MSITKQGICEVCGKYFRDSIGHPKAPYWNYWAPTKKTPLMQWWYENAQRCIQCEKPLKEEE